MIYQLAALFMGIALILAALRMLSAGKFDALGGAVEREEDPLNFDIVVLSTGVFGGVLVITSLYLLMR